MNNNRQQLADYQATLLELLADSRSIGEVEDGLRSEPSLVLFQDYTSSFEPRMVEVAAELTKRWGRRKLQLRGTQ